MHLRLEIFPKDIDLFLDFYTRVLRFSVDRDESDITPRYATVHRSTVHIGALQSTVPVVEECRNPPMGVEIVLEVDDLEFESNEIVSRGWPLETNIVLRPWGLKDFRVRDPDGYYLRFTTSPASVIE